MQSGKTVINGVLQEELQRPEREHQKGKDCDCVIDLELFPLHGTGSNIVAVGID